MDRDRKAAKEMIKNFTFKQKVEHFWYYYGKYTIIGIFALAFVIYTLVDCMMQVNYDLNIAYYTCSRVNKEGADALADSLEPIINDISGNKKTDVQIVVTEANITKDGYDEMVEATLTKIPVEMSVGEFQMYLLDEHYLEFFNKSFEGFVQSSLLISDIPEIRESLGVPEGEKLYLIICTEYEHSKDNEIKIAERENAALVMEYFKNMMK